MTKFKLLSGVSEIPEKKWDLLVGEESPFLEWGWLASLEDSGAAIPERGWGPQPIVIEKNGELVAACPLYLKGHSEGEFIFDWSWAEAAQNGVIKYYPKFLVGVPFTPVTGARFLTKPGEDRNHWIKELEAQLRFISEKNQISSVHINFCLQDEIDAVEGDAFQSRLSFQYHWHNIDFKTFEDYLGSLRSKRRNQIKREIRSIDEADIEIKCFVGEEIEDSMIPIMYQTYLSTNQKNPWGRQYLNEAFFELLQDRFRKRLCFILATRGGTPLAGTINVIKGDTLYGRYWGCFQEIRHLHFAVCYYAGIRACIENGLSRFEPGAGGHYKQLRGFDPVRTRSLHYLLDSRLAEGVRRFLASERKESEQVISYFEEHTAHRRDKMMRIELD